MKCQKQGIERCRRCQNLIFSIQQSRVLRIYYLPQDRFNLHRYRKTLYIQECLMIFNRYPLIKEVAMLRRMHIHFETLLHHQFVSKFVCFAIAHFIFVSGKCKDVYISTFTMRRVRIICRKAYPFQLNRCDSLFLIKFRKFGYRLTITGILLFVRFYRHRPS